MFSGTLLVEESGKSTEVQTVWNETKPWYETKPWAKWTQYFLSAVGMVAGLGDDALTVQTVTPPSGYYSADSTVVEEVGDFIRRFVFLREDSLYDLAAAWVIGTYLIEAFDYVGYLFAYSPEKGSGKSRFLQVLGLLVKNPTGLLHSPTESVLFRSAATTTQLLDEVDSWSHTDSLRGILNAGFQRGGVVWRTGEANDKGKRELEKFSAFGPKALAGIRMEILSAPTRDRTFMFEMVRQTKSEKRERLSIRKIEPEASRLKAEILKWSEANKDRIEEIYDQAESAMPYLDDFGDRTIDIALPLATIIEAAYADSPKLEMARFTLRKALSITRNEQQSGTEQHDVIRHLLATMGHMRVDPLVGNPTELSAFIKKHLNEDVPEISVSNVLRQYGFKSQSRRLEGGDPRKRYEFSRAALEEIIKRYGAQEPAKLDFAPRAASGASYGARNPGSDNVVSVVSNAEGIENEPE